MTTTSDTATSAATPQEALHEVELAIGVMTCASCANRIERKLNKLDGVTATVNCATEKAKVHAPAGVDPDRLVAAVEAAGYTARLPVAPTGPDIDGTRSVEEEPDPSRALRQRLITSTVLSVPVVALAMVPALQFTYWQWISVALAGPVVVWAGRLAVPPCGLGQPAPRRRDDGYAHLPRRPGRVRLVALRPALRHPRISGHDPWVRPHRQRR
jgi:Cu+-exporting ATPase